MQNYRDVFRETASQPSMWEFALNSVAIVVPATIIPIAVAAFAAYGFAWMDFRGRNWLFIGLVSMIALPNQMAFVPLLQLFNNGARLTIPGWTGPSCWFPTSAWATRRPRCGSPTPLSACRWRYC